jgi:D-alanyl-lipoteichoic acid acyltransferase DltB (MBOAT superfamily)
MISTAVTFASGRLTYNAGTEKLKRIYIGAGFAINLFILMYFKYSGFLMSMFVQGERPNLMLPAGISFYTFQSLTYIIDCYRGETEPENNFLKYALFVSFFPCILSGPIERSKNLLPQIDRVKKWDALRAKEGLFLMLWGYFLKMVIVSRLDILTDNVYSGTGYCGIPMLTAMLAYSFLIYCDFAGYSFIAIGAARVLGFDVMRNFRQPYLAVSVADFWRRWHISLSTWFRDYLYIPLGGNRKGTFRRYLNIIIVFALSGIWHGATSNYLVWGLLYGMYQVIGYAAAPVKERFGTLTGLNKNEGAGRILCRAFTFILVSVTWVFFRAEGFHEALDEIYRTFTGIRISQLFDGTLTGLGLGTMNLIFAAAALMILIAVDIMCEKRNAEVYSLMDRTPVWIRWAVYYLLIIMILFSCNLSTQEFLYQGF